MSLTKPQAKLRKQLWAEDEMEEASSAPDDEEPDNVSRPPT